MYEVRVGQVKDCFDPHHERPHVDTYDLADLGYIDGPAVCGAAVTIVTIDVKTPDALNSIYSLKMRKVHCNTTPFMSPTTL